MTLYEVAVAAPLARPLTYQAPVEHERLLAPGTRVLVPLGRQLVTGYVLGPGKPPEPGPEGRTVTLRPIIDLLDEDPVFPAGLVPLFRWIADYYHHPLGEVIRTALPGGMTTSSGRVVRLTASGKEHLNEMRESFRNHDTSWLEELCEKGSIPAKTVRRIRRGTVVQRLLNRWERNGWIVQEQVLGRDRVAPRRERVIDLHPKAADWLAGEEDPDLALHTLAERADAPPGRAEQTLLRRFLALRRQGGGVPVPRKELSKVYSSTSRVLPGLLTANLLIQEERRVYRNPFGERPHVPARPEHLSEEQEQVLARLLPAVAEQGFHRFLLFGVTGCGKTEVYLQAAARVLENNRTVLVLVPEIALASQVESHFHARFGDRLAVLHSGLSSGQRLDEWQRILKGRVQVVIGARSAVFAPLSDLGLIIVDEEHEPAYKQEDGLRYNGRDLAVLRARFADCPVVLGSATPSLNSFHNARTGKYTLLTMARRITGHALPEVEIVNLQTAQRSRPDLFFSDRLIHALEENMEQGNQSLLFVNRRGFASFMLCRDCGEVIRCSHCRVSLTLHRARNTLVCHYCGYTLSPEILCPGCRTGKLVPLGLGSERIEDEVRQILPHARVARLDSDTAGSRKAYLRLLREVRDRDIDVLIGTQMIAKGLHFPHVTLVGVVWADSGLNMPDYKAAERTFSLLSQVTGRAGRGEHPGRVIIQTSQPEHYAVQLAATHDYEGFYERELPLRRELGYPPLSRLANIRCSGPDEQQVQRTAGMVGDFLKPLAAHCGVQVLGPAPSPLSLLRDRHRFQLLLKAPDPGPIHILCERLLAEQTRLCPSRVRLSVDIDPENMM